jgi:micrococcal nuclease
MSKNRHPKPTIQSAKIFAFAVVFLLALVSSVTAASLVETRVNRVIDGDTIEIIFDGKKESVRLIGVDTPETKHPTKGVQPYGPEASAYTKKALEGKRVWLEWDVEQRDRYGRLLAYVWTAQPTIINDSEIRNKMFNAHMLLDGYAQLATFPPNVRYVERFRVYQSEARGANRGLWGIAPSDEKQAETKTLGYVGNLNSRIFHRLECSAAAKMSAKNRIDIKNRDEAVKQGYRPCKICNP